MVKRLVVGAHYGLGSWLAQRVTAAAMAVYTVVFATALVIDPPAGYADWRRLFSQEWMRFATLIFLVSMCYHAWVGMRDILMDYAKPTGVRLIFHAIVVLLLVGYAGWALQILWRG